MLCTSHSTKNENRHRNKNLWAIENYLMHFSLAFSTSLSKYLCFDFIDLFCLSIESVSLSSYLLLIFCEQKFFHSTTYKEKWWKWEKNSKIWEGNEPKIFPTQISYFFNFSFLTQFSHFYRFCFTVIYFNSNVKESWWNFSISFRSR